MKNTPGRVFERRTKALQKLNSATIGGLDSRMCRMEPEVTEAMIRNQKEQIEKEKEILQKSLSVAGSPRNLRSKKDRTAKAKISYK